MERKARLYPAYDKRHVDPSKDYGIHGVDLRFVLIGEHGAMQFVVFTNWQLPHVTKKLIAQSTHGASPLELEARFLPLAAELSHHSRTKTENGRYTKRCDLLDGECWCGWASLAAERIFERLLREGDAAVWEELEKFYVDRFGELV